MKLKLTYTVYLFPFLVSSLSASTIELEQIETRHVNNQVNMVVTDSSSDSGDDDEFAKEFCQKEVKIILEYSVNNMLGALEGTFLSDPNRAKKFLKKAKNPFQVPFTTFLNDYIAQLEECIQLIREHKGVFHLFSSKKYNLTSLYSLSKIGSRLAAMYRTLHSKDKPLEDIEQEIKEAKKEIWGKLIFSSFNDVCHLKLSSLRNIIVIWVDFWLFPYMKEHLKNNPPRITTAHLLSVSLISSITTCLFGIGAIRAQRKKNRKQMWLHIFYGIDIAFIYSFNRILSYQINHFLCNPIGLIMPFWNYYTMKYAISPMSNPDHERLINLLEKEKTIAIDINSTEDRVQFLYTILQKEQKCPKPIARIINSFLDVNLFIQKTYPKKIENMQSTYYTETAILPTTTNPIPYLTCLDCCKMMSIASFVIGMLMGGFYFGVSLFSIVRAIDRAS